MKENFVLLHGQVQIAPKVYMNKDGVYTKAVFAVKTLRRPYHNGEQVASRLFFDCPVVFSKNADMIARISELSKGDMVDIRGVLTTQEVTKSTICSECAHKNSAPGNMVYVTPIYICKREAATSEDKGLQLLKERCEVSNIVMVIGTLCREPETYTNEYNKTSVQYQIAVNRKYRIREDAPDVRTDYPWVKTYNSQTYLDSQYVKTGSSVYINGCLQTRDIQRKTVCEQCGTEYAWMDTAMEIIPYSIEYLSGCDLPEPKVRQEDKGDDANAKEESVKQTAE